MGPDKGEKQKKKPKKIMAPITGINEKSDFAGERKRLKREKRKNWPLGRSPEPRSLGLQIPGQGRKKNKKSEKAPLVVGWASKMSDHR